MMKAARWTVNYIVEKSNLKKPIPFLIIVLLTLNAYAFASVPPLHINNQNQKTKINSSNLNFGTNTAYSSSKTQATIGLGTITVKDKENSDDIANINRDINTQTNKLYEGSTETSVDASIDHRLFTEEGRNSIKEDIKTTSNFASILVNTALKESMSLFASDNDKGTTSLFDNLKLEEAKKQATLDFMLTHPDEARVLNDPDASAESKQAALSLYADLISSRFNVERSEATLLVAKGYDASIDGYFQGAYAKDDGTIFINDLAIDNAREFANTLGHEESHYLQDRSAIADKGSRSLNEQYANIMGEAGEDYFSFGYSFANLGELSYANNHIGTYQFANANLAIASNTGGASLIAYNNANYDRTNSEGSIEYKLLRQAAKRKH